MKPFDTYSHCDKCGDGHPSTKFKRDTIHTEKTVMALEVMERTCRTCGFQWDEKPKDSKDKSSDKESAESQIERLGKFIMNEIPGEPSQSQGAVDTAIRLLRNVEFTKTIKPGESKEPSK